MIKRTAIALAFLVGSSQALLAGSGEHPENTAEGAPNEKDSGETVKKLPQETKVSWTDAFTLLGDLRYRNEGVYKQDEPDRNRHRLRARLGAKVKLVEGIDALFRIATGSDDPVSTNQTLTEAFTTKNVGLDLACFDIHPGALDGLSLVGGKMKNPFHRPAKTELVWDGDLNPEGMAFDASVKTGFGLKAFGCVAGFWVQERKKDPDSWMAGAQAGASFQPAGSPVSVTAAAGFYHYENLKGFAPLVEDDDGFGNTLDAVTGGTGTSYAYALPYNLVEGIVEVSGAFGPVKATVFFDGVRNLDGESGDTGWLVGAKASLPGGVSVHGNWRRVERDAVVGVFTDSDFIGGGTGGRGLELGVSWKAMKHLKLAVSYFDNTAPLRHGNRYRRFQADVSLSF